MEKGRTGRIKVLDEAGFRQALDELSRINPLEAEIVRDSDAFGYRLEGGETMAFVNKDSQKFKLLPRRALGCLVAHEATEMGLMQPKTDIDSFPFSLRLQLRVIAERMTEYNYNGETSFDGRKHIQGIVAEYETAEKRNILPLYYEADIQDLSVGDVERNARQLIFNILTAI